MEKGVFNRKMRDEEITKRDSFNESFIKKYIKVPVYTLDKMMLLNNPSIEKAKNIVRNMKFLIRMRLLF